MHPSPASAPAHALILAAGQGSRLRPLTDDLPKPLLPIDGRAVIERVLDQVAAAGIKQTTVVVGYRGDVLRRHLEAAAPANGWPTLSFVTQEPRRGSAHALITALDAGFPPVDAVVAGADTWWRDEDVLAVVERFRSGAASPAATMGLRRWPVEQLPHRSLCVVDDDLRVRAVLEKPTASALTGETGLSGSPLYVLGAELWPYVRRVEDRGDNILELALALQAAIDDGLAIAGVEVRDTRDLTRPADLLRHNFPYLAAALPELG